MCDYMAGTRGRLVRSGTVLRIIQQAVNNVVICEVQLLCQWWISIIFPVSVGGLF